MLTNSDLTKIGALLDSKLDAKLEKKLSPIAKSIRKIQKDMKTVVNYFDEEYLNHDSRIRKIETHLGFQSSISI